MKDIVKQFEESISKLTPEEFKKIWDEIEAEIGTDYPVFNTKTNCFEYKINNTETLEKAIEENYWNTITLCEDSDNTNMKYVEELINTSFINGVEFAQQWISVKDKLPITYKTGDWDGKRSDLVICKLDNDKYCIARLYSGKIDGFEYNDWLDEDNDISYNVTHWRYLELK